MNPYYYDELPVVGDYEELMMILGIVMVVLGVILFVCLVFALLRSLALYSIAKRRGIRHAWLAWLPVGKDWILGSLSDQYQHLALGQIKSRRKVLLVLNLAFFVVGAVGFALAVAQWMAILTEEPSNVLVLAELIPDLLTAAISVTALVFYHICNYDLYRSCDPKNAVVYLVVGIVLPITEPFFYLANRRKDDGMPQPQPEMPTVGTVEIEPMFRQ